MIETCRLRTSAAADARLGPWRRTMTSVSATDAGIRPSRQPSDRLSGPGKCGALWAGDHGHDPHRPSPNTRDSAACQPVELIADLLERLPWRWGVGRGGNDHLVLRFNAHDGLFDQDDTQGSGAVYAFDSLEFDVDGGAGAADPGQGSPAVDRGAERGDGLGDVADNLVGGHDADVEVWDQRQCPSALTLGVVEHDRAGDCDSDRGAGQDGVDVVEFVGAQRGLVAGDLQVAGEPGGVEPGWHDHFSCAAQALGDGRGDVVGVGADHGGPVVLHPLHEEPNAVGQVPGVGVFAAYLMVRGGHVCGTYPAQNLLACFHF